MAVSCINTTENICYVGELNDNEFYTELETLVAQITPKECVIPSGESAELSTLKKMLERNGVLVSKQRKSEFDGNDVFQDLDRLLYFPEEQQRNSKSLPESNKTEAMGALQAVVKYLNLTEDEQNFNQFKLTTLDIYKYVRLDNAAINALNLLPKPGATGGHKFDSVFGVLDKCYTAQGRRMLEQWLKQPLRDINLITERHEVVEFLLNDSETRNNLSSICLPHIPDLLMLAKKLCAKKATLQDCYRIYQAVETVPNIIGVLKKNENKYVRSVLADPLSELLVEMEKFQAMIEETVDLDLIDRGEFYIKSNFDEDLNGNNK